MPSTQETQQTPRGLSTTLSNSRVEISRGLLWRYTARTAGFDAKQRLDKVRREA